MNMHGFWIYLGPNDRALPFDWPNEKNIPTIVEPEGQWAVLPCQVTHYTDKLSLTKVGLVSQGSCLGLGQIIFSQISNVITVSMNFT